MAIEAEKTRVVVINKEASLAFIINLENGVVGNEIDVNQAVLLVALRENYISERFTKARCGPAFAGAPAFDSTHDELTDHPCLIMSWEGAGEVEASLVVEGPDKFLGSSGLNKDGVGIIMYRLNDFRNARWIGVP